MNRFISREQLYREVWKTPLTKLAPIYNLTTYEMKKLCDTFLIPLPKVGHWSKVAFGKTIVVPPLPVYEKCKLKIKKFNFNKETQPIIYEKIDKKETYSISVKKTLTKLHPLTIKTRNGLKRSQTDEYGMKRPWKEGFDLRVSKVNERRALLIIDALCKWFEKNSIEIYQPFKESRTTEVIIDKQRIRIKIEEKSKLTSKTLTKGWGDYEYYTREYTPTEKLSLVIDNYCWGCSLRKVWTDGKTSKVEEKLGEFVATIFEHAQVEKEREQRLEAEAAERAKQKQLQKYNEACEKYEKQMLDDLMSQSRDFIQSRELKAYIEEVNSLAKEQYKDGNYPLELSDWINWAEAQAKKLNPLSEGLPTYKKAIELLELADIG
ncbi:hypothetical protein [Sulfurovum sp. TSL1]|uniref:hypothetical protein n=1 Tax=Sulfurovum sp. TSL1 TaxID=2826994 RepID=UPI001CC69856|nr:hypothetical protein [Sulfurovum sp. TSL1]GIT98802.1 hypothetical protein TSL1_16230 [Sulfurovum sp. TSL1]